MPDYVVETDSVNSLKSRLDKYWANQEFVFNFNSELILEVYQFVCNSIKWYACMVCRLDAGIEDTPEPVYTHCLDRREPCLERSFSS